MNILASSKKGKYNDAEESDKIQDMMMEGTETTGTKDRCMDKPGESWIKFYGIRILH